MREHLRQAVQSLLYAARRRDLLLLPRLVQSYICLRRKPPRAPRQPVLLGVELTTRCMLSCKMCFRGRLRPERIGDMSVSDFRRVLEPLDSVLKLCLSGLGENFLHPELFRLIGHAKRDRRIPFVWMATNGQAMDRERAAELQRSGLDWLLISIDSPDPLTYREIRRGADLDLLERNIQLLVEARRRTAAGPRLTLVCTVQRDNIAQLEDLVRLAARLEVPDVLLGMVIAEFAKDPSARLDSFELPAARKAAIAAVARATGVNLSWGEYPHCFEPWTRPCVTWDGYLIPCYIRPAAEEHNFGNVLERPFADVWNGSAMCAFRGSPERNALCSGCPRIWR